MDGDNEMMDLASAFEELDGDGGNDPVEPNEPADPQEPNDADPVDPEELAENPDDEPVDPDEPADPENPDDEDLDLDVDADADKPNATIPDDAKITYIVDGKPVTKTFAEMRADAQRAHGADAKFQEAAAIRKEYEAKAAALPENEAKLKQVLDFYVLQAQQFVEKPVDWAKLLEENPTEYVKQRHAWEVKQGELLQAKQIQEALNKRNAEAEQASRAQRVAAEKEALLTAIPEWRDPVKGKEGAAAIGKYLQDAGIPDELLQGIDHHQVLVIARKAMLYDQAIAKQKAARENGGKLIQEKGQQQNRRQNVRVERPGAGTPVANVEQRSNLRKANAAKAFKQAPSVDTLAGLFES